MQPLQQIVLLLVLFIFSTGAWGGDSKEDAQKDAETSKTFQKPAPSEKTDDAPQDVVLEQKKPGDSAKLFPISSDESSNQGLQDKAVTTTKMVEFLASGDEETQRIRMESLARLSAALRESREKANRGEKN